MLRDKPLLLVNWDYHRKDLTAHIYALAQKFDLVFISYYNDSKTPGGFKAVSWNWYKSPKKILKDILPDKIIFHDIESFHQIALNIAARQKGIETIVLEHGLRRSMEVERELKLDVSINSEISTGSFGTFLFLIDAFRFLKIKYWWKFMRLIYLRKKFGLTKGLHLAQYEFRQADRYINFTELNAGYIIKRDGVPLSKITFIGNPQFDGFFQKMSLGKEPDKNNTVVLFDSPFEEDPGTGITAADKEIFFSKIADYCKSIQKKLVVKLHPVSFKRNYQITGVEFVREGDLFDLILSAWACIFIHNSGLLSLAMYCNKTILFNTLPEYNVEITEDKLIPVYDFYHFKPEEIHFREMDESKKNIIVKNHFFSTDGKATERLIREVSKNAGSGQA